MFTLYFSTFRKTEYTRHNKTEKHLKNYNNEANNVCICGNVYVYNSSYNKHIEQCEKYISSVKDKVDMQVKWIMIINAIFQ